MRITESRIYPHFPGDVHIHNLMFQPSGTYKSGADKREKQFKFKASSSPCEVSRVTNITPFPSVLVMSTYMSITV